MIQDYLIGTQLDEYRLERLLGRGGMARVYRGLDVNLNRPAAIKIIDIPHRTEEEYVQRFKREAQAIARLDHPHIVRLYRYGEVTVGSSGDNLLYMAMQFIQGADLDYVLKSYRNDGEFIEIQDANRIIREICAALDYAHENGIIHRDVKPSNIMLDTQGRVVLTDFGLALLTTQATRGEIFGSPQYISPEQAISSARAVPQSDLYAVGVIIYEMFTGSLPFAADEPLELALMHINNPAPSPRMLRPELSQELEAVILKALEKRPEDRYPTGQALSDALENALAEKSPSLALTSMTLPQRVTQGLAKENLAISPPTPNPMASPPAQNTSVEPTQSKLPGKKPPFQFILPWAALRRALSPGAKVSQIPAPSSPSTRPARKPISPIWIVAGVSGLLLVFLCIISYELLFNNPLLANPTPDAVAAIGLPRPTATLTLAQTPMGNLVTLMPAQTPTVDLLTLTPIGELLTPTPGGSSTPSGSYSLEINRRGQNNGYLVLKNMGDLNIPIENMNLRAERTLISGSIWGIEELTPDNCLLAWKENGELDALQESLKCDFIGHTATIGKKQEEILTDKLYLSIQNRLIGTCGKGESVCRFTFSN
ncbi:MAG: protein kinase [Chloroflexi bacterium]|nr:protein kinase [Chloroflexota bacterium]